MRSPTLWWGLTHVASLAALVLVGTGRVEMMAVPLGVGAVLLWLISWLVLLCGPRWIARRMAMRRRRHLLPDEEGR